jgi:hypothetical protein
MRRACIILTVALCLAECISILFCSTESVGIQAATGSFNVTPSTPSPSPTASPIPTVTPVTPTPSPTSTTPNGGSNQPSISLKLSIDIEGQKAQGLRNSKGKMLEDITASSADGKFTLRISSGTFVLDADGEPITEIYITVVDPLVKAPPLPPPTNNYFIYIYEFLPDGASVSEPIEIKLTYDSSDLPKSPGQLTFKIYSLNDVPYEWKEIPCISNIDDNTITLSISHMSMYALTAEPFNESSPLPQNSPIPTQPPASAPHHSSLILLILILPAVSLMFFIYVLLRWHRRNRTYEDADS